MKRVACILALIMLAASCESGSKPERVRTFASSNSTASHSPVVTSPATAPEARDPLTGLGATRPSWVANHGGLDVGNYSGVQVTGVVTSYSIDFPATNRDGAELDVESDLPGDAKVTGLQFAGACFKEFYRSRELAALPGAPFGAHGGFSVYFYTGFSNGPYDSSRVNNAIVDNVSKNVAC